MREINPCRRNTSAEKEIAILGDKKENYIRKRSEKMLEIDVLDSTISSIEAQIANIMMKRSKTK